MPKNDAERIQTSLPLCADPASGALIGTFLLAACLAGPVGLGLALVAWILIEALQRGKYRHEGPSPQSEPAVDELAARFRDLENGTFGDDRPGG